MRSYSMISMMMSGVRIAGELSFTPAHLSAKGIKVSDRVGIPVISNSRFGKDREGKSGRSDNFKLVAWGGLGLSLCRYGSTGKALDVIVEPHSYEGTVYNMAPNPQNPAELQAQAVIVGGQTLTTEKVAFTVRNISYGEESAKQIQRELTKWAAEPGCLGGRPAQWNVIGSPDAAQFTQILEQRKAMLWDGISPFFGFARVVQPRNAQRLLTVQERAADVAAALSKRTAYATPQPTVNAVNQVTNTFQGVTVPTNLTNTIPTAPAMSTVVAAQGF